MDLSLVEENKNIDHILSRLGFGCYQVLVFVLIGWFNFTDGAEIMVISIITKVLEKEWALSNLQIEVMGAIIYLGMIVGTIVIGPMADKYGRKRMLNILSPALVVAGVVSGLMPGIWSFIAVRALLGVFIGGMIPIGMSLLMETSTKRSRGSLMVLENLVFQVGAIAIILLAM